MQLQTPYVRRGWKVHEVTHEAVAKFSVEGTVRGADIFQKLLLLVESFLCAGADQHNGGNGSNNIQITDHVALVRLFMLPQLV